MHVVVFTRSSVARALASTPICCSMLQYTKRTKPSADTWAIVPWVRVVPSFLCASLFQSICVRLGDDVFLVAAWYLLVIFTRYRIPLLGAFSRRPSVSSEPSAARMPLLILWLSPTGYCCRERHNSLFVLEYTSSRVWYFSRVLVWYVHTRCTLYEAKQGCTVVSCTTFTYWGACWSKVLVLIWHHMYVREDCYFWFFIEIIRFFSRYLVVGSRYDFFFGFNNMRRNTCRSDFVRYRAKTWKQPCVTFRGQGDAAVRQIVSMNYYYGYTIVNCVWPHYSGISQLADVFCNKLTADAGWRRIYIYVGQITIYVLCWSSRS